MGNVRCKCKVPIGGIIRYGEASYTSGNTVLWEDLRDGKLYTDATGTTYSVVEKRKRPIY